MIVLSKSISQFLKGSPEYTEHLLPRRDLSFTCSEEGTYILLYDLCSLTYLLMFLVKTPPPSVRMGHYLLTVFTGLHPDSFPLKGRDKCSLTTRASISPLSQTTQIRGRSIIYSLGNALL